MQIQSIDKTNFNGLYKVPANNISEKVTKLVEKHRCSTVPSANIAPKYFYILTPDNKKTEDTFEKAFLENGGQYWKSKSIKQILNKEICEKFFNITKTIDNKENWVEGKINQDIDIPF